MRVAFVVVFLIIASIALIFISNDEHPQDPDKKNLVTNTELLKIHEKFLKIDVNDENLDLVKKIQEVKEARKLYPLDDKLKMLSIELEHKRANQTN